MTSNNQPSRRDWFRLKWKPAAPAEKPQPNPEPEAAESASQQPALNPVAKPVNHAGLDLSDLPPMRQADLSKEQVSDLFADVADYGSEIQLMVRSQTDQRETDLAAARAALLSGRLSRLQIRYRWQGKLWIDTLQKTNGMIRLIRIAHQ